MDTGGCWWSIGGLLVIYWGIAGDIGGLLVIYIGGLLVIYIGGLLVAYWLQHWTVDQKVRGSSLTSSRDFFLFWVQPYLKTFSFVS